MGEKFSILSEGKQNGHKNVATSENSERTWPRPQGSSSHELPKDWWSLHRQ